MKPAAAEGTTSEANTALRRFGPLAALAAIALAIVGVIVLGGGGDDGSAELEPAVVTNDADTASESASSDGDNAGADDAPTDGASSNEPAADTDAESGDSGDPAGSESAGDDQDGEAAGDDLPFSDIDSPLPPGVMSFGVAQDLGLDVDFGERCDPETGRVKVRTFFATECFAPFVGDNGGATARGVTEDTIRIVQWIPQDVDPVLAYITSAIANNDTNAQDEATIRGMIEYFETYYETYGRSVELIVVEASGNVTDQAAARADAVRIDEELDPFMVWGGPTLNNAFAEELAARGIPCFSCGPTQNKEWYQDNAGLAYAVGKGGDQLDLLVAEYIGKRLAGDPAIHAGDESMHDQERVFGRIWIESSEASAIDNERFEATAAEFGFEISESQSYTLNPATLQESASTVIARMKAAGVTSIIFNGDPIAPRDFTNEATAQDYFPEWIVTGSALVDTSAFSRTYDQEQWANAFGVSNLAARVVREIGSSYAIYEWFHGEPPPSVDNIGVLTPVPNTFYAIIQGVGPNLTIENFQAATFAGEPTPRALSAPSLSWGNEGIWPEDFEPDYRGVDDVTEVWWDPNATGPDEIDRDGSGLWRYVAGGLRYKPGEIPEGPPAAFVEEGSVTIYDEPPPGEGLPEYEPLNG